VFSHPLCHVPQALGGRGLSEGVGLAVFVQAP